MRFGQLVILLGVAASPVNAVAQQGSAAAPKVVTKRCRKVSVQNGYLPRSRTSIPCGSRWRIGRHRPGLDPDR